MNPYSGSFQSQLAACAFSLYSKLAPACAEVSVSVRRATEGKFNDLFLDFYSPEPDPRSVRPAVVLMHGGYFTGGMP